jgi:hypothetical protein
MHLDHLNFGPPRNVVTATEIDTAERQIGLGVFPPEYRSYLTHLNGAYPSLVGAKGANGWSVARVQWLRDGPVNNAGTLMILDAFYSVNSPILGLDLVDCYQDFRDVIPKGMFPFANDPGGSQFLIDMRPESRGQILFWNRLYADQKLQAVDELYNVGAVAASFIDLMRKLEDEPDEWV